MTAPPQSLLAARGSSAEVEQGAAFQPLLDKDGLLPAIVTDAASGEVLMFAWMNSTALELTLTTGHAHFWSRSRNKLWLKGEESGNTLRVVEVANGLRPGRALAQGRGGGTRRRLPHRRPHLLLPAGGPGRWCHSSRRAGPRALTGLPARPASFLQPPTNSRPFQGVEWSDGALRSPC